MPECHLEYYQAVAWHACAVASVFMKHGDGRIHDAAAPGDIGCLFLHEVS
jgi:hypothetical protein